IMPTELAGITRWQFLAEDATTHTWRGYSIQRSSDGGFDLEDSIDPDTGEVIPDAEFTLVDGDGNALALNSGMAMTRYDQQEWQENEYGTITLQKREMRVMVAV